MSESSPGSGTAARAENHAIPRPPVHLLLVLSGMMSLGSLSTDMYLPALPTLAQAFGVTVGTVQLTLTTFLIGFCSGQLIWGPIGDRFGRRGPAAAGLAIFALGSVGCALSGTVGQMIAWRAFQAFGASAGPVLGRAMVRDLYAKEQAARMLSLLILVMGIAPLLGPILGGFVLLHGVWQDIFWVQAALGLGGVIGVAIIQETWPLANRARIRPIQLLVNYGEMITQRQLLGYVLSSGFYYGATYAYLAGTPFVYIELYHVSPQAYGWLFGLNIIGLMAMNAVNSRLVMTVGADRMLRWGVGALAVAGVVLAVDAWTGWGGLAGLVAPVFVVISMNGAVVANAVAGALSAYPRRAGAASAVVGAIQFSMGILTTALTGWLADGTAFTYAGIIGVMGMLALFANRRLAGRPAGG